MNEDRVLSFLNLKKDAKRDKFMPKLDWGMNIGFSILIGGLIVLTSFSKLNVAFAISFVVVDLLFGLILVINRNPAWQVILDVLAVLILSIKLFIGYLVLSKHDLEKNNIPIFTWVHLIAFFLVFLLAIYVCSWMYRSYKISKKIFCIRSENKSSEYEYTEKVAVYNRRIIQLSRCRGTMVV